MRFPFLLALLAGCGSTGAGAADIASSYSTPLGRSPGVIALCPSVDGSYAAVACEPASITPVSSSAVEAAHVLKASPGTLYGVSVTTGNAAGYVLVLDSAAVPLDGPVSPKKCYQVAAGSTIAASWQPGPPVAFANGITVVLSTTGCLVKTASATAFITGEVQ